MTLTAGTQLALITLERDGKKIVPMFSSPIRLQVFIRKEMNYLAMNTPDFLNMTRGATLILNPGSDYGKEFTPGEVESILNGTLWQPSERYVTQKPTKVLMGQPANYPTDLVAALTRYFSITAQVERAFLVHIFMPDRDQKGHTLIAIEVTGDWEKVAAGAGMVARDVKVPDPPVDFFQITDVPGFSDHFRKDAKPFYTKNQTPPQ
jgi:hypothetical protein